MEPKGLASMSHVLIVDDDPIVRTTVGCYLEQHQFRATAVASGDAMLAKIAQDVVDLVLLEACLGRDDGMKLTQRLREDSAIPIIMLSGRGEEADRVMGLELGADDYVTKPFSLRELLARVRAVLRRRHPEMQQGRPSGVRAYRFHGMELNLNTRRLTRFDGSLVALSNCEFSLLVAFLGAVDRILTRDQLLDMTRLHNDDVYNRSVDTQIMRLRKKICPDPVRPRYLLTERGAGYMFSGPVDPIY